jgi:hypothetical protein
MLLNFGLQQKAPNIVSAPKSNLDINSILGLSPSQYSGLQNVRDTGYYYGNNRMYEKYTPPPPSNYGGYYGIMGYNRPSNNIGIYGYQPAPKPSYESMTIGDQEFRTASPDIQGFSKMALEDDKYAKDSVYEYSPSMAYVYSQAPKYQGYDVASAPPVVSLTAPTAMNFTGSSGAGRFLGGTDGLLGSMPLSFGLPSGESANG